MRQRPQINDKMAQEYSEIRSKRVILMLYLHVPYGKPVKGKRVAKLQKLLQSSNKTDFLAKCQKLHNMLNIHIFDLEISQS